MAGQHPHQTSMSKNTPKNINKPYNPSIAGNHHYTNNNKNNNHNYHMQQPHSQNTYHHPLHHTNHFNNFNTHNTNNPQTRKQYYNSAQPTTTTTSTGGTSGSTPTLALERLKADATTLFNKPGRDTRPSKIVVIMRGLPGSGKTHYAKLMKDYEAKYGGASPRIFCIDDYFMTEVDKEEEDPESGTIHKIKALDYQYEAAMEEPYQASVLKQFRKCLTEGFFPFIIVDNVNARIADFEQYCSSALMAGYEVYILQTPLCDLKLLAQRNVHNKSLETIEKLNAEWQDTPYRFTLLNIENFGSPDDIKVVDMTEDDDAEDTKSAALDSKWTKIQAERSPPKETDKGKGTDNEGHNDKGDEVNIDEPKSSITKKPKMESYQKKVRWADLEYQKEIDRGSAIGGSYKRKRFGHDSDSEEEAGDSAPKQHKPASFLDKVKEEQENFKVHLLAKQALEQVKYIGPKETEGHLEDPTSDEDE